MRVIYLQSRTDDAEWHEYRYHELEELRGEFDARGIFVGKGCDIGNYTYIGNESSLHDGVKTGEEVIVAPRAVVGEGSLIGDLSELGFMCCIGRHCRLGQSVFLGKRTILQGDDTLEDGVQIGSRTRIGQEVRIGSGSIVLENNVIGGFGPVCIGNKVWIGNENHIFCNTIGNRARIGRLNYFSKESNLGDGVHISSFHFISIKGKTERDRTNEIEAFDRYMERYRQFMDRVGQKPAEEDGQDFPSLDRAFEKSETEKREPIERQNDNRKDI